METRRAALRSVTLNIYLDSTGDMRWDVMEADKLERCSDGHLCTAQSAHASQPESTCAAVGAPARVVACGTKPAGSRCITDLRWNAARWLGGCGETRAGITLCPCYAHSGAHGRGVHGGRRAGPKCAGLTQGSLRWTLAIPQRCWDPRVSCGRSALGERWDCCMLQRAGRGSNVRVTKLPAGI